MNAKEFEKEARPEIRKAGERAYRGHQMIKWVTLPSMAAIAFLYIYFIHPH